MKPIVLVLHGFHPLAQQCEFLQRLGTDFEICAPAHPGFGETPRPDSVETMYDLLQVYLTLLESWSPREFSLIGLSFGGWLAAEIALVLRHRLRRLVLVDPVGIKISGPETADILDIFNLPPASVRRASWHDESAASDFADEARDREALCRYGWHPYLHNPRLRDWLHCIPAKTLLLWGESDGIVTPAYGAAWQSLMQDAQLQIIPRAGHHPELEQPAACAEAIAAFLKAAE